MNDRSHPPRKRSLTRKQISENVTAKISQSIRIRLSRDSRDDIRCGKKIVNRNAGATANSRGKK